MQTLKKRWAPIVLILSLLLSGCAMLQPQAAVSLEDVPAYSGAPYVEIDGNQPDFTEENYTTASFEEYAPLDLLGRCGTAYACISTDLVPTEERGSIGQVKPSGWHTVKYDFVDGKYLYNRCHLIGYQLTGENANECNLITGTRYLNVEGMLPFENLVADYIRETGNHVLYRATPVFEGSNLVASGVQLEGWSVEDEGDGICFNVYCYNVQPGVTIDYATGESRADTDADEEAGQEAEYVLNTRSKKFHLPDCASVDDISESNKEYYEGTQDELLTQGYTACGQCVGRE